MDLKEIVKDLYSTKLGRFCSDSTVAYLLKAGTVEPDNQPLLAKGSQTKFVSR
jgi:hypothetical protein